MNDTLKNGLRLDAAWKRIEASRFLIWIVWSILYFLIISVLSAHKLLWKDELFTLYFTRLNNFSDLWSYLSVGTEQIPPLFYLLTQGSIRCFGETAFGLRFPEMVGFWLMGLCLFHFIAKRYSTIHGLAAMLFPLITNAYYYAYEARPYGILLGMGALSLLCWQRATEQHERKLWIFGLILSNFLSTCMHYYGILLLVPLAIGEMSRAIRFRKIDFPVWIAFGFFFLPLIIFFKLILQAQTYSAHFWGKPGIGSLVLFYDYLLRPSLLPIAGVMIVSAILSIKQTTSQDYPSSESVLPFHEVCAAVGFISIPFAALVVAFLFTGAFSDRYAITAVIGFAILFPAIVQRLAAGRLDRMLLTLCFVFAGFLFQAVHDYSKFMKQRSEMNDTVRLLESYTMNSALPIVVASPDSFFQLSHYTSPNLATRLFYLADRNAAMKYIGTDHIDRGLIELKPLSPLKVEPYRSFIQKHDRFLLLWESSDWSWILHSLIEDRADLQFFKKQKNQDFFLVSKSNRERIPNN